MNFRHLLHVFRKDSIEILRDRRALFVNVVLPALLYPFIVLFMLQVTQLTKSSPGEPPQVVLIDLPDRLRDIINERDDEKGKNAANNDTAELSNKEKEQEKSIASNDATKLKIIELQQRPLNALRTAALDFIHLEQQPKEEQTADYSQQLNAKRQSLLAVMREHQIAGMLINTQKKVDNRPQWYATYDNAHARGERVRRSLFDAVDRYRLEKVQERLELAGLGKDALHPFKIETEGLAPIIEMLRTNLAGIIPLILVLMAVSGAFSPAIDLIAGERERGTLESLLSWPVRRHDLFIGKLLVTCAASLISVLLNLTSLGLTMALMGKQLSAVGANVGDIVSTGVGTLALCLIVLIPLTLTISALSLVLAGLAASTKEAQNYLTPLLIVVMIGAIAVMVPDTRPSFVLDLIPITGSVLALKEALQGNAIPWVHLFLSTGASLALAAVIVTWATRMFESEQFCYPGMVRAGWGRFRTWGTAPSEPNGLEVMGVFGVVVAGMTMGAGIFMNSPVLTKVAAPLLLFVLMPALIHTWLGAYKPQGVLRIRPAPAEAYLRVVVAIPFALLVSMAIASLQPQPPASEATGELKHIIDGLKSYGLFVSILVVAILPGICEELLCRGSLLTGLNRGLGVTGGVLVSSFLFASLHLSPYRFLPQMTLGIVLALLALRYRSIWPCVLLHAGHNAGALLLEDSSILHWLEDVPPLAALGVGILGLWFLIVMPKRSALDHNNPGLTSPTT